MPRLGIAALGCRLTTASEIDDVEAIGIGMRAAVYIVAIRTPALNIVITAAVSATIEFFKFTSF